MPASRTRVALVVASLCYGLVAQGAVLDYDLNAGVGRTDNLTRTSEGDSEETLKSVGARFTLEQDSRRVEADLLGDLQLTDYSSNSYSTDLTGNVLARLRIALIEDRLRWDIEDNFGQTQQDLFSVPTPDNRENVNYFATGPQLFMPLGRTSGVLVGARYTRIEFEDSPSSSTRIRGSLAAQRRLPSSGTLSLNLAGEQIDQRDGSTIPTYERLQSFLRYELNSARTTVAVDIGANRLDLASGNETGALLRLDLARNVGRFSRVMLGAGQEFTDAGNSLQPGGAVLELPETTTDFQLQTQQPFTSRYATVGWELTGRYTRLALASRWDDEEYVGGGALDVQRWSADLAASRDLGARTTVSMAVRFFSSNFAAQDGTNDELIYNLALSREIGRRLGLELSAERNEFTFDAIGENSDETRLWLRLSYGATLGRPRTAN